MLNKSFGYKYVAELNEKNLNTYLTKSSSSSVLHYSELEDMRGFDDKEAVSGIYFCKNQTDLKDWILDIQDIFGEDLYIEIFKVYPIGQVKQRVYDDGSTAYICASCTVQQIDYDDLCKTLKAIL